LALKICLKEIEEIAADLEAKLVKGVAPVHGWKGPCRVAFAITFEWAVPLHRC